MVELGIIAQVKQSLAISKPDKAKL